ncbi:phosphate ABC transporter permease subunit PstC [Rhodococcus aerolatus]
MTTTERPPGPGPTPAAASPRALPDNPSRADSVFRIGATGAGAVVLALLALIAVFLAKEASPAFATSGFAFFTTVAFNALATPPVLGVLGLLLGTVVVAVIAVSIAIPISVLTALYITQYAGDRLRGAMIALVDLLAAIPSLLYGLWGFAFLSTKIVPVSQFLSDALGFIPLFRVEQGAQYISSYFIAGLVVSLMTLPIITSIVREVFAQTPPGEKEAALALGSTRFDMIRTVVLPFGRGGIIGGSMLGLGRALGETIAVSLLLPQLPTVAVHVFQYGGSTIAGYIANNNGASGIALNGLLAAGLVLFGFTLVTNFIASVVISRSRSGAGVD